MKRKTFRGGVHPPERKERTDGLPVEAAFPPSRTVCIPVTQGGAPNAPVVREGDPVRRGQVIASSDSPVSVPVHASVSGTVKKIEKRLVTGNTEALCVVIEAAAEEDGAEGKTADMFLPPLDPFACTPDEALARIRDAGIVGMGGAAFPAHVKFRPPADMPVQTVIANGAECEPYLTADACVLETGAAAVLDGLAIVMRITGAKSGILALEDNKRRLLPGLEAALAAFLSGGNKALELSLKLVVIYCVWMGVFGVMEKTGLSAKFARLLKPVNKILFGNVPPLANDYMALNISANILGMSGATTPMGIKSVQELEKHPGTEYAIAMFFVINATSVQLIPSSVLALRTSMGSASPSDIILPTILATLLSSVIGILLVKIFIKKT